MASWGLEIAIIFLLLVANGIFAMSELAIVSAKKIRLQQWANEGNKKAQKALDLSNSPGSFLSTVQIGITLVGVLSGTFGGVTLATQLADWITAQVPEAEKYSQAASVTFVVVLLTYFSVIIGELVPKRLALGNPEKIALLTAGPMRFFAKIAHPIVRLFSISSEVVLAFLGVKTIDAAPPVTQEEIKTLVEQGAQAGVFEESEKAIMDRVLDFGRKSVNSLMTPRPEIVWLDINHNIIDNIKKMRTAHYSDFPVVNENLDNVLGTVHVKDIFSLEKIDSETSLNSFLKAPLLIPEGIGALHALEFFKETGIHIGFVIDEFGSVLGLVTMDDILRAIVGGTRARSGFAEKQAFQRADGSWLLDGTMPIDDFKALFRITTLPGEEKWGFQTVAGFVMSYLKKIPKTTENFVWNDLHIEVMDMDKNRIDKLLVTQKENTHEIGENLEVS
jgi:putative hemolysin